MFNIDITWMVFGFLVLGLILLILAINIYTLSKNNARMANKLNKLEHRTIEIEQRINRIENKKNNTTAALASAVNCLKYINTENVE